MIIAIVLFTRAADKSPERSPIPYSAPLRSLILETIPFTSQSTPP